MADKTTVLWHSWVCAKVKLLTFLVFSSKLNEEIKLLSVFGIDFVFLFSV